MLYAASHLLQLVFNVSLQFLYASPYIALSLSKWLLLHSILRAGALLCRVLIEHMSDHNVRVFVSLAGPQAGIFGSGSALLIVIYW